MTWFKVDDSFDSHPKAEAASLAAIGLWTVAGAWCGRHLTDGNVPDHVVPRLSRGAAELADELVASGLWRRTKSGYRFHQWSERNPTRGEATAARDKKSSGGVLGNHRRWHLGKNRTDADCPYCQPEHPPSNGRTTDRISDPPSDRLANPPDPSRPVESSSNSLPQPDGFEEFWRTYPPRKNSSKADARKAYAKALKDGADPDDILAGTRAYADERAGQDQQFTAHAKTWLNGKRWEVQLELRRERPTGARPWWEN